MNIITVNNLPDYKTPHQVSVKDVFSHEHVQVVVITLQPGESLLKHLTPVDVFFYVLEGEGVVEIGDEKATVVKDQLIESPKKIPHRLWNESDAVFRFLVVKTPKQKEKSQIL